MYRRPAYTPTPTLHPADPVGFSVPKFTWEERVHAILTLLKPQGETASIFCEAQGFPVPETR